MGNRDAPCPVAYFPCGLLRKGNLESLGSPFHTLARLPSEAAERTLFTDV